MKLTTLLLTSAISFAVAAPQGTESAAPPPKVPPKGGAPKGFGGGGTPGAAVLSPIDGGLAAGPYKSGYVEDTTLPKHTIFAPINPPADLKMPILIWGNGACSSNGTLFRRSLWEVASHGIFAIANGAANGAGGQTTAALQKEALDWIDKNAGQGKYANLDKTRIAAAGQSCGGLETYKVWDDKRVSFIGIFNSGEFSQSTTAPKITKPIFYFLGGSSDIAYANGERDYKALPKGTPRWKGNLPVGHMATWSQTNGGKFGKAEWLWLDWVLRGNAKSGEFFLGDGAKADGWEVEKADLDKMPKITPIQ